MIICGICDEPTKTAENCALRSIRMKVCPGCVDRVVRRIQARRRADKVRRETERRRRDLEAQAQLVQRREQRAQQRAEAIRLALEDAQFWHENAGLSPVRSARLASRFHKARWTVVYAQLRDIYGYRHYRGPASVTIESDAQPAARAA